MRDELGKVRDFAGKLFVESKRVYTMKKQRIMWVCLTLILTTSFFACSSDAGKEADLPQVEKTEMLSGFLPLNWVSDDSLLGFGDPLSPKPHEHSLTYPDYPVQYFQISAKTRANVKNLVIARFDRMDSMVSPGNRYKVITWSKGFRHSIYDITTQKSKPIKDDMRFFNYCWLNDKEFIYKNELPQSETEKGAIYKCNAEGVRTLIGKVDEHLDLLFVYGNRIYFSLLLMGDENNKQTIFYTSDIRLSKVEKIAQFRGEVYLVGDSIILKKLVSVDKPAAATGNSANSNSYVDEEMLGNYSLILLDKDFKEKETFFQNLKVVNGNYDTNTWIVDINCGNMLYRRVQDQKITLCSMELSSRKTVELYNMPIKGELRHIEFGINFSRKKVFLCLEYYDSVKDIETSDAAAISLK